MGLVSYVAEVSTGGRGMVTAYDLSGRRGYGLLAPRN